MHFFDIPDVTVQTGAGHDRITLGAAGLTAYGLQQFTIDTGAGDDSFVTHSPILQPPAADDYLPTGDFGGAADGDPLPPGSGYATVNGYFLYNGGSGTNELVAMADTDWRLQGTTLTAGTGQQLAFSNVGHVRLVGGAGSNLIEVLHWNGTLEIDGAGDTDRFYIAGGAVAGATIADTGESGLDELTIAGTAEADAFLVTANRVRVGGTRLFDYAGIEVLRVAAGDGDDALDVGDSSAARVLLDGEAGSDKYQVLLGTTAAEVYVSDSGPLPSGTDNVDELSVPSSSSLLTNSRFAVAPRSCITTGRSRRST